MPLLFNRFSRHILPHQIVKAAFAQGAHLGRQIGGIENLVALLVDHLALVVSHIVVLQQLLAHVEVARLHLALGALDGARHNARLNRFTIGHFEPVHDGLDPVTGKNPHQRVIQTQVKARRARVALATGATAQLVVDATRLVALGGDDAQTAQSSYLVVVYLPLGAQGVDFLLLLFAAQGFVGLHRLDRRTDVAAQHNVGAAPGHVGGDGDDLGAPGLGDDFGFTRVLLGVEHLVRQFFLFQQPCDYFRVFNRGGAHQHRLAAPVALADVLDGRLVFFARGFIDPVELIIAPTRLVGRHHHRFQAIDLLELIGFGIGGASHAGQLGVKAEVVLEGNRRHGLVFGLNGDAFLGFHRLVQAFAPAPPGHQAAGEFIDDHDFAVLHHIVLITEIQVVGAQGCIQVMHQRDIGRVIQAGTWRNQPQLRQNALGAFMPLLGQEHLMRLFINRKVARLDNALAGANVFFAFLLGERWHHLVNGHIQVGLIFGLTADDQRRARLINEDGIHLIDNGVIEAALDPVSGLINHVVAQVVKAEFVVGAVGDVGAVCGLLFFACQVGQIDANRQTQKVV